MSKKENKRASFIERAGKKIPDPVIIFAFLFAVTMILTIFMGGMSFETLSGDGTTISYGGNQGWFFIDENEEWYSWLESDYLIQNYGCGLISPSDTLLYLALSDNQYSTYETELVSINLSGYIDFNSYQCYIRMMNLSWFKIMRWVGVNGLQIANGIKIYIKLFAPGGNF